MHTISSERKRRFNIFDTCAFLYISIINCFLEPNKYIIMIICDFYFFSVMEKSNSDSFIFLAFWYSGKVPYVGWTLDADFGTIQPDGPGPISYR